MSRLSVYGKLLRSLSVTWRGHLNIKFFQSDKIRRLHFLMFSQTRSPSLWRCFNGSSNWDQVTLIYCATQKCSKHIITWHLISTKHTWHNVQEWRPTSAPEWRLGCQWMQRYVTGGNTIITQCIFIAGKGKMKKHKTWVNAGSSMRYVQQNYDSNIVLYKNCHDIHR